MEITFDSRLEAVDWIAAFVEDEKQFEILREQLNYNFIYQNRYFLDLDESLSETELRDPA